MNEIQTINITIKAKVSFHSYNSKRLNARAIRSIKSWISQTLNNEARYIPLYVEKDSKGTPFEDATKKVVYKVK